MSVKLLFLHFCCSCWDFSQPCIGFLSVVLLLGLCSCCLLPFVCLSCDVLGSVLSDLDVSVPSATVHEHKPVLKHGAGAHGRVTTSFSLKPCKDCSWAHGGLSASCWRYCSKVRKLLMSLSHEIKYCLVGGKF